MNWLEILKKHPSSNNPNKSKPARPSSTVPIRPISGNMSSNRITPNQSNTDEFIVVEQNTARVNLIDIAQIPTVSSAVLNLTTDEGFNTVKNFISAGKKFSEAVIKSRSSGKKFIRTMGLLVNIQTDTDQITNTDLTKQRTMALCHMILHNSGKCTDFNSPLVGRINFNETNPLTGIRPLIGAGFQFLGKMVISTYRKENYKDSLITSEKLVPSMIRLVKNILIQK